MLYRNKKLDDAFEFISHADFDIFCLQEVPETFLARLKTLPYSMVFRTDSEKVTPTKTTPMFNVILSKHTIHGQNEIPFTDYWPLLPLRTRFFIRLMPSRFFARNQNRGGIFADIVVGDSPVRVFNLHLALAHPARRLEEFEQAMTERNHMHTVVCGDFNILETPHIAVLNWLLSGRVADALFYTQERTTIEKRFVEHKLTNALRGTVTHPVSRSQLDHILVSHNFSIKHAEVLPDRFGSDHHPIRVEII